MKCIFCKKCGDLVPMTLPDVRTCECGNVRGRYAADGFMVEADIHDKSNARIIGINNMFLKEEPINWDDPLLKQTLFGIAKSNIISVLPFTTGDIITFRKCPKCEKELDIVELPGYTHPNYRCTDCREAFWTAEILSPKGEPGNG